MKVLALDHATAFGGAELSLLALLGTLDSDRFPVTLGAPPGPLADGAAGLGVPVIDLRLEKLRIRNPFAALWRYRKGCAALRRTVDEQSFDLVHANTLRTAIYAAGAGVPFLWHARDFDVPGWAKRRLLARCEAAIAISEFIARSLGNDTKVHLIRNGLEPVDEPSAEDALAFRREVGLPEECPVVGIMGRIRPWKGQMDFLDAAAKIAEQRPHVRFLVVGATLFPDPGRDYVAELKAQAAALGLTDKVVFCGHRPDPLVALSAMDVGGNCSRNEPFGRVLLEAMACRRPVVAFRSGAVPEVVVDGQTGVLVPYGENEALVDAVLALLDDPHRARELGEAGRRRVESDFPLRATIEGVEALYAAIEVGG